MPYLTGHPKSVLIVVPVVLVVAYAATRIVIGLETQAPPVAAIVGIWGLAVAFIVGSIGWWIQLESRKQSEEASTLPDLVPWAMPQPEGIQSTQYHLDNLWQNSALDVDITNVGPGVAMDVCGLLFPPSNYPQAEVPAQFYGRHPFPIPKGDVRTVTLRQGRSNFTLKDRIDGCDLAFPTSEKAKLARLTLSWRDILNHKHAVTFDIVMDSVAAHHWEFVKRRRYIEHDLLDRAPKVG